MPIVLVMFVLGLVATLYGIYKGAFTNSINGVFYYGPGVVMVVTALFLIAGLNGTAFYPSYYDLQSSLTIQNASSSHYTLNVMAYVSLLVPCVIGTYSLCVACNGSGKKITSDEIEESKRRLLKGYL